jgi:hypothetical protein
MVLGLVAAAIVFGAAALRRWLTRRTLAAANDHGRRTSSAGQCRKVAK